MSTFLAMAFVLCALTNAAIFAAAQASQHSYTQTASVTIPRTVGSHSAESTPSTATSTTAVSPAPQSAPAPAPAPAPARAATPAPATDTISIPSIGLSSRFVSVGLTSTNAVDVNPTLAGWFDRSSQPGTIGAAFFDGHNPGVFRRLPSIQVGAQITVTRASGEVYNYSVVHIDTVMLVDVKMSDALQTYGGASEGLNLMTCVGTYSAATGTTDQRLIVYAVRS